MARKKRNELSEGKKNIIAGLLEEYDIQTAEDIQSALADLLGGTIKGMMEAEMEEHLGYEKSARNARSNSRNGYKPKKFRSRYGEMFHKIEIVLLNLKLFLKEKRIFLK